MRGKKAVLFDAGQTLLRFEPDRVSMLIGRCAALGITLHQAVARKAVAASELWMGEQIKSENAGAPRLSDEEITRGLDGAMAGVIAGDDRETLAERLFGVPWATQEIRPFPDAVDTLEKLKTAGYRLAIVSNWSGALADVLDELGLTEYFEQIVISEVEGVSKPDPRIIKIALERMAVSPDEAVYVGDHPYDVLCAKEAGVDAIWIANEDAVLPPGVPYAEDARVQTLTGLLPIFAANEQGVLG